MAADQLPSCTCQNVRTYWLALCISQNTYPCGLAKFGEVSGAYMPPGNLRANQFTTPLYVLARPLPVSVRPPATLANQSGTAAITIFYSIY